MSKKSEICQNTCIIEPPPPSSRMWPGGGGGVARCGAFRRDARAKTLKPSAGVTDAGVAGPEGRARAL
eukprot:11228197-Lingulodinium_polyedra.AAC.1